MTKETKDFIYIVAGCFALSAIPMAIFLCAAYLSKDNAAPIANKSIEVKRDE